MALEDVGWWSRLTRKNAFDRWRRKRRHAVSPVIAELLLIVITVAIGTLVYSFASAAFGGFGSGFSNLVQNAGDQLSENLVVEQAYFYNSVTNNTDCAATVPPAPPTGTYHCGGVLYVRNVGVNPVMLDTIYMGNVTAPGSAPIATLSVTAATCSSNSIAQNTVCFFTYPSGYTADNSAYDNNLLPMTASNEIMPGAVMIIHFLLPDSSFCSGTALNDCTVAHGGTTYAFTLVTSRGNDFVAYERA